MYLAKAGFAGLVALFVGVTVWVNYLSPSAQASRADPDGAPVCTGYLWWEDCSARDLYLHIEGLSNDDVRGLEVAVVALLGPYAGREASIGALMEAVQQDLPGLSSVARTCVKDQLLEDVRQVARHQATVTSFGQLLSGAEQVVGAVRGGGPQTTLLGEILGGGGDLLESVGRFGSVIQARGFAVGLFSCGLS